MWAADDRCFHHHHHHHHHVPSWRVRCVSCSLILKMKLVPPSLPRSSYVPSSFWFIYRCLKLWKNKIQSESLARGPKLLSIKNYVIKIMTWEFIYTYREWPAHNWCWNWSPFTSKHIWMRFSKFWNTFSKVLTLRAWISWRIASLSCSIVRGVFLYTLPFNRPKERSRQALDRLPLVSNFLTNFWVQNVDGACFSPNSVRNAVWHALNEPACQYLRTRNSLCSTVYTDNSLGPPARDSPCITLMIF